MFHPCLKVWRALWVPSTPLHATPSHSTPKRTTPNRCANPDLLSAHPHWLSLWWVLEPSWVLSQMPRMESGEKHLHYHLYLLKCLCGPCWEGSSEQTPGCLFSLPPSPLFPTVHLWRTDVAGFPFLFLAKWDPPQNHVFFLPGGHPSSME